MDPNSNHELKKAAFSRGVSCGVLLYWMREGGREEGEMEGGRGGREGGTEGGREQYRGTVGWREKVKLGGEGNYGVGEYGMEWAHNMEPEQGRVTS